MDRFNNLAKKLKAKMSKEVRESGGGDDGQTEVEKLLEGLEVSEESERKCEEFSDAKKQAAENEKRMAIEMKDRAVETFWCNKKEVGRGKRGEEREEKEKVLGEDWNGKEDETRGTWEQNWGQEESKRAAAVHDAANGSTQGGAENYAAVHHSKPTATTAAGNGIAAAACWPDAAATATNSGTACPV